MIENIKKSEIRDYCHESKTLVCRVIDIRYDIEQIREKISLILQKYPAISKDRQSKYRALSLQYVDEKDLYYDCVESTRYINEEHISIIESRSFSDWTKWNNLGQILSELYQPLNEINIKLYRTRLLIADPNCQGVTHIDYDYRFHIPITTNDQCFITYEKEKFHLPSDGHAYIVNAGYMHSYYNYGETTRCHYCGIMSLPCKGDGLFDEALRRGGKRKLNYQYT